MSSREFDSVFAGGRRVNRAPLIAVYRGNDGDRSRLGLAIAKKAVPQASDRNRLKRSIREQFRQQPQLPPVDVVFYAQARAASARPGEIRRAMDSIWQEIQRRCASSSSA